MIFSLPSEKEIKGQDHQGQRSSFKVKVNYQDYRDQGQHKKEYGAKGHRGQCQCSNSKVKVIKKKGRIVIILSGRYAQNVAIFISRQEYVFSLVFFFCMSVMSFHSKETAKCHVGITIIQGHDQKFWPPPSDPLKKTSSPL